MCLKLADIIRNQEWCERNTAGPVLWIFVDFVNFYESTKNWEDGFLVGVDFLEWEIRIFFTHFLKFKLTQFIHLRDGIYYQSQLRKLE